MNSRFFIRLAQLAPRYPLCAACIVLSVLLADAGIWLYFDLRDLGTRQRSSAAEGEKMLHFIRNGPQLRADLAAARTATQRITEHLIVERNVPENYGYFLKIEQDTKVKLNELQPRPAPLSDTNTPALYKRVPYSLRVGGAFPAIIHFLRSVETGPRLARIKGFQLQRADAASANLALTLHLDLLAFP